MDEDLNIRKKIRTALLPDPSDYSSSPLNIKTFADLSNKIGQPNAGNFIDLNPELPSYDEDELPKIHVSMGNELSVRNSISFDQRNKSFTMEVTCYSSSYLEGEDFKFFKNEDREKLLTQLENVGIELDMRVYQLGVDRIQGITGFDVEAIDYEISRSQSGEGIIGNTKLSYSIEYYIQYPK